MALLDDLKPEEETPARTPWWLLLLRMIALALAILGFARPTWAPNAQINAGGGMLIVVDDGWTSAERWRDIVRTATSAVDEVIAGWRTAACTVHRPTRSDARSIRGVGRRDGAPASPQCAARAMAARPPSGAQETRRDQA